MRFGLVSVASLGVKRLILRTRELATSREGGKQWNPGQRGERGDPSGPLKGREGSDSSPTRGQGCQRETQEIIPQMQTYKRRRRGHQRHEKGKKRRLNTEHGPRRSSFLEVPPALPHPCF